MIFHAGVRSRVLARLAMVILLGSSAMADDKPAAKEAPPKVERPKSVDRPLEPKPDLLSPPPDKVAPSDEQRAIDYRSNLEGEIKRLEREQGTRRDVDRRDSDNLRTMRRERHRIDRAIGR